MPPMGGRRISRKFRRYLETSERNRLTPEGPSLDNGDRPLLPRELAV